MTHPAQRYLIVGDEHDLAFILPMIESFDRSIQGNVILELPTSCHPMVSLPPDLGLTVLSRGPVSHVDRGPAGELLYGDEADRLFPSRPRGERAREALESWCAEWLPAEETTVEGHGLWVGMVGVPAVDDVCTRMAHRIRHLHLHRPGTPHGSDAMH